MKIKLALALLICLCVLSLPMQAQILEEGFSGALSGAMLGALVGGRDGAAWGAAIGGGVGMVQGANETGAAGPKRHTGGNRRKGLPGSVKTGAGDSVRWNCKLPGRMSARPFTLQPQPMH